MKTLTYNKLLKYALLLVTLATLILSALFFFIPKKQITASASAFDLFSVKGDFTQETCGYWYDSDGNLYFESQLSIKRDSTFFDNIDYIRQAGYYAITVYATDIAVYYELDKVSNAEEYLKSKSAIYQVNYLIQSTGHLEPIYGTVGEFHFDNTTIANYGYGSYNKTQDYYVFSLVLKGPSEFAKTNFVEFNETKACSNYLKTNNYNEDLRSAMQHYLGCYNSSGTTTVNVNYLKMKSYSLYENATVSFTMDSLYVQCPSEVEYMLYSTLASKGFTDITSFNADFTYKDFASDGTENLLSEKIVREALSLELVEDYSQTKTATVNVVYKPFTCSDVCLRVSNNDPTNLLEMPVYTTDIKLAYDNATYKNYYTITFNYAKIQEQLYNSCTWVFVINSDSFEITNTSSNVEVNTNDSALTIKVAEDNVSELFGLSLVAVAEIIPDFELFMTYKYIELDDELNETIKTSAPVKMWYTEYLKLNTTNFYNKYKTVIDEAISPDSLGGGAYYKYAGTRNVLDMDECIATITVLYDYVTTFRITSSTGEIILFPFNQSTSLEYVFKDFKFPIPEDYRICSIKADTGAIVYYDDKNPLNSIIKVTTSSAEKTLLDISVEMTDKWFVKVNYLEQYKSKVNDKITPFMELKTAEFEERVSTWNKSIYDFNTSDVINLLGVDTLNVMQSSVDKINVKFDNVSTYTIDVEYTVTTINRIDYDGNLLELKIKPTPFSDWANFFGQDWTIRFLNMPGSQYFKFVNDISADKLYGYFSVAVFEEQASDINYYFQQDNGVGCMALFKSTEIKGDDLYEFFGGYKDTILGLHAHVGMALCEIVNNENAMYESCFFYVDGTSEESFISNSGADNSDDTDSAIGNITDDVIEGAGNAFEDFGEWWEEDEDAKTIKIILYVALGILLLGLIFWVLKKIGLIK